jgi:hypothetical protein
LLTVLSLLLALVLGELIDSFAEPRRRIFSGGADLVAWRACSVACIWLLAFGLTGRPVLALVATLTPIGFLVAISNAKLRTLREPLVFTDIALLEHVWRHPHLFYMPARWRWALPIGALAPVAAIVVWMMFEPRTAGLGPWLSLVLAIAAWGGAALWPTVLMPMAKLVSQPDPQADVMRLGILLSLMVHYAAWRLDPPPHEAAAPDLKSAPAYDAIVVRHSSTCDDWDIRTCICPLSID